jgi:hypothetical protein
MKQQSFIEDDEIGFDDNYDNSYNNSSSGSSRQQTIENPNIQSTVVVTVQSPGDFKYKTAHAVRSTESFLNDSSPEYFHHPEEYIRQVKKDRTRRRKSRELPPDPEIVISSNDEEPRRKPETMRSISEDTGSKLSRPMARRSFSHPEKETQVF